MPRDIPVGNGRLLVCFDKDYRIRDLYYPRPGQENHVVGAPFRLGVSVGSAFSWVDDGSWRKSLDYEDETLVTLVSLYSETLGLLLTCRDAVDFHEAVLVRELTVENIRPEARLVRLFLTQDFQIYGNTIGDTGTFDPETGGVVHYKGTRYFLAGGMSPGRDGLAQYAVGLKGVPGHEGAFRDAEDGVLSGSPVAQGSVDSVVGLDLEIGPSASSTAWYWLCAGQSWPEVRRLDGLVRHKGPAELIRRTAYYWRLWRRKETPHLDHLPEPVRRVYGRSLLVMLTNVDINADGGGGIIAANDSDLIEFNRDTYSYIWGRDGSLTAHAFDMAGYPEPARRFYEFCARAMHPDGFLMHKYNPDGSLASSWHPWVNPLDGSRQLPIQEDETALAIWALWNHFVLYRDMDFIKPLYRPLIKNAADFMVRHRNPETGLPAPCYDLWEERWGISAFTVGAVFGGLTAASLFCTVFGQEAHAERYRQAAIEIRDAASIHLWREDWGRFCRALISDPDGNLVADPVPDASLWGLFEFGLYTADDPRIESTMRKLREVLWVDTEVGGMARFTDDLYYRADNGVTGNPWFICTLWQADWLIERATSPEDMAGAVDILSWAAARALPSGILAEQLHPRTGEPISATPLTWSQATFVTTVLRYLGKLGRLGACPQCALSVAGTARIEDWLGQMYTRACDAIHGACRIP